MLRHQLVRGAGGVTDIASVVTKVFDHDSVATWCNNSQDHEANRLTWIALD
jgi:hypothetical protein